MVLLFDDRLAPITSRIGFLEINAESAAKAYEEWMRPILADHGFRLEECRIDGDLESILLRLEPLVSPVPTKYIFMPTNSKWTAFFDNGWRGGDTSTPIKVLAGRLNCRGLSITAVPHSMPSKIDRGSKGRYGATIMELFGPQGKFIRTVYCVNDGGKWKFGESGIPLDCENVEMYKAKKIRDRFTTDVLNSYLRVLGIEAFNESFYAPDDNALLIKKVGIFPPSLKEYSLNEVRKDF